MNTNDADETESRSTLLLAVVIAALVVLALVALWLEELI